MSSVVCLMGPTASGKTQLAVKLTQIFPFEIISVDSAMVYRGMDIGSAKPTPDILTLAPHRLIDIRDPHEIYSAAQFREDALKEIQDIHAQQKIPLLVGGTMLYFRALQHGLATLPARDQTLRDQLFQEGERLGWPALHKRLASVDIKAASRIHPHDRQRIQRALEVYELTGKNLSDWQDAEMTKANTFSLFNIALAPEDRSVLHERIALRFKQMLAEGLVEEVQKLFQRADLSLNTPALRAVGYRQVWQFLRGDYSYEEMCDKAIIATRQLAKRQLTWLRNWKEPVTWFDSENEKLFSEVMLYLRNNVIRIR